MQEGEPNQPTGQLQVLRICWDVGGLHWESAGPRDLLCGAEPEGLEGGFLTDPPEPAESEEYLVIFAVDCGVFGGGRAGAVSRSADQVIVRLAVGSPHEGERKGLEMAVVCGIFPVDCTERVSDVYMGSMRLGVQGDVPISGGWWRHTDHCWFLVKFSLCRCRIVGIP